MTKNEFLSELRKALVNLKSEEKNKTITFYSEMIDDRIDSGISEEEAVLKMGDVKSIANGILEDAKDTGNLIIPKSVPTIVLLIIGFPLWFPIIMAFLSVALALYIVVWVLVLVCYVIEFSMAITAIYSFINFFLSMKDGAAISFMFLGITLMSTSAVVLLFKPIILLSKKLTDYTCQFVIKIKEFIVKKVDELK